MRFRFFRFVHLLFALAATTAAFAEGRLTVTVLNCTTHGLAIVLQTPGGRTWLVDTGPSLKEGHYPARDVIAPFLRRAGVKALDGVVISHPHTDHVAGLPYLIDQYAIGQLVDGGYNEIGGGELVTYRRIRAQYVAGGGKSVIVKVGSKLDLDPELEAEILWPPAGLYRPDPTRKDDQLYNANSVVLRVRHGANVFIFPGDHHGIAGVARFVPPDKLHCDFLVAPHHGLNSSAAMAQATKPRFVVVSAKREQPTDRERPYELTRNAFGPGGAVVYATAVHGDVTAVSDGHVLTITTEKPTPGVTAAPVTAPTAK